MIGLFLISSYYQTDYFIINYTKYFMNVIFTSFQFLDRFLNLFSDDNKGMTLYVNVNHKSALGALMQYPCPNIWCQNR